MDIGSDITGSVTINVIDQTLPQILDRLSRQLDIAYRFEGDNLIIGVSKPYFKTYTVNYINISRTTSSSNVVSTSLETTRSPSSSSGDGGGGGGSFSGNLSSLEVSSAGNHQFWTSITNNILAILSESAAGSEQQVSESVVPVPEAGVIMVKATDKQHEVIQSFLDIAQENVRRQALIQVTI